MAVKKSVYDYYSSWEGWYCNVEDENGNSCGEVIGSDTSDMVQHLKEKHNIIVKEANNG